MQFMLAINNILKGIRSILTKKKENLSGYGRLSGYGDFYNDSELQDFDSQTLGKPTIKFEFENNEDLKNFLKENKENLIESYIDVDEYQDNSKALNGYGDKYEVVDNRKRARKEPGELSATKNLEFTKVGKAAENYNKDAFNTEKFKKVVFIREFDGTFIEFNLFVAQTKSNDKIESRNVKKGADGIFYNVSSFRTLIEAKNIDMYNISDYEPHKYQAYITLEKYDEFYKEALKSLFDYIQREINSVKEQIENFDKYQYLYYKDGPDKKKKEEKRLNEMLSAAEQKLKNNIAFYNYGYGDYSDDLGKAGDLYIVRDLRTRAKKEPGETIANKNLNFVKIKDAKIENFNKELYENKTVFDFDRDFNEYKSVRIENKDNRNIIEFVFFLPTKRLKNLNENALGGRLITVGVDIDIQKAINIQINPYSNSNKPTLQRIEADARKTKEYNYYYIDNNSTKDYYGWITDKYYNQLRQNGFNNFYNDYINREERFYTNYQKKLLKSFYSNPQKFEIYQVWRFDNDFSKIDNKTRDSFVGLLQNSALNGYGLDIYNCPLSMLDCKSMHPTYQQFNDYSQFIEKADNESKLFGYGFEKATLNTLRDTVLDNYQQVKELAKILKGETDLQTFFNIWYFLHEQIKYGLDAAGKEEIRTPARCWTDRFNGVDCDCLAVFTAALLINLGYNPKFEIVAMNNNPNYEHIYVVVDGIVIDRVLPAFNERPKNITKTLTMDIPVYQLSGISGCKKSRLNGVTDDILSVTNYDSSVVAMNNNEDDFSKVVINLNTTAETENPPSNSDSVNNEYIYSAVPEADTKRSNKTAIGFFAIFSVLSIYALLKK